MREQDLRQLHDHAERLIALLEQTRLENSTLRAQIAQLEREREDLKQRNTVARERVESIIARLRTLESHA